MKKFIITIEIPTECPEGSALLCLLAELIKDVPSITEMEVGDDFDVFEPFEGSEDDAGAEVVRLI
jgi:hypothetical protein